MSWQGVGFVKLNSTSYSSVKECTSHSIPLEQLNETLTYCLQSKEKAGRWSERKLEVASNLRPLQLHSTITPPHQEWTSLISISCTRELFLLKSSFEKIKELPYRKETWFLTTNIILCHRATFVWLKRNYVYINTSPNLCHGVQQCSSK